MQLDQRLLDLAQGQCGLLHRTQLYRAGVTRAALRWRLGSDWQAPLPGVVALFRGALDGRQRVVAAWLYAGDDSVVTGVEAARAHGLKYLPDPATVRLFVGEHRCRREAAFVDVRPSTREDPGSRLMGGVRIASPARAVVDAARDLSGSRELEAVVLQVVQRRLATVRTLRHELERSPVPGSRLLRRAVLAAEAGSWSAPEADYLRLLRESPVMPEILPNPALEDGSGKPLPTPDLWVDDVCLALQVHSREHHTEGDDFDHTLDADSDLTTAGATVLGVTPGQIRRSPARLRARVESLYVDLAKRGFRPAIRVVRRAGAAG